MSKLSKQLIAGALSVASATAPLAVTTMNATSTLAASKKKAKSKSSKKVYVKAKYSIYTLNYGKKTICTNLVWSRH